MRTKEAWYGIRSSGSSSISSRVGEDLSLQALFYFECVCVCAFVRVCYRTDTPKYLFWRE